MVKRFSQEYCSDADHEMKEDPQGEWVKHSDFEKVRGQLDTAVTLLDLRIANTKKVLQEAIIALGKHGCNSDLNHPDRPQWDAWRAVLQEMEDFEARQTLKELGVE